MWSWVRQVCCTALCCECRPRAHKLQHFWPLLLQMKCALTHKRMAAMMQGRPGAPAAPASVHNPCSACMAARGVRQPCAVLCRSACWRHMYGAFTVWIDTAPDDTEEDAPQRGAYSGAEVRVVLKDDERDGSGSGDLDEVAESVVAQVPPPPPVLRLMSVLEPVLCTDCSLPLRQRPLLTRSARSVRRCAAMVPCCGCRPSCIRIV